jgi:hypothetical protein
MAPWYEPSSRTCYASKMALLKMEKEKDSNKDDEEMMNHIKELFPAKQLSLENEEVLEGHTYEESYQEDLDDRVRNPDKTFDEDKVLIPYLPLDEDIKAIVSPTDQEDNIVSGDPFEDLDDILFHDLGSEEVLEEKLDMIDPLEEK